jgi:hypothetical protein
MQIVPNSSTSTRPVPLSWVESLFARMQAMYGNKFIDMWRDADLPTVKAMWADEMGKLNSEELRRGYGALITRDWPPTLPEYIRMCKPSIDPTVAYYEAVNGMQARERGEHGKWSHPAIFWAAVQVSSYDLKHLGFTQIRTRWEKALADEMEKGEWAAVPEPMIALPAPGKSHLSREKATAMLSKLGASGVLKPSADGKHWARKIMQRVADNDPTLSAIQLRFAREALEVRQ